MSSPKFTYKMSYQSMKPLASEFLFILFSMCIIEALQAYLLVYVILSKCVRTASSALRLFRLSLKWNTLQLIYKAMSVVLLRFSILIYMVCFIFCRSQHLLFNKYKMWLHRCHIQLLQYLCRYTYKIQSSRMRYLPLFWP